MRLSMKTFNLFWFVIASLLLSISPVFADTSEDNSPTPEDIINIIHQNDRLNNYFEDPISKDNVSSSKYLSSDKTNGVEKNMTFHLTGTKKDGTVTVTSLKDSHGIAIMDLAVTDTKGVKHVFIDLRMRTGVFTADEAQKKNALAFFGEIVDKVESQNGYFVLTRSPDNNDFMQVGTLKTDDGKPCLFIEYSEGYTPENKKMFRVTDAACPTKAEALKLLYMYATGSDKFKKETQWTQLKNIDAKGNFLY
jgi:hypothetical protein